MKEAPRAGRNGQESLGADRSNHQPLRPARTARSLEEPSTIARSSQEPPGSVKNRQEPPRVVRRRQEVPDASMSRHESTTRCSSSRGTPRTVVTTVAESVALSCRRADSSSAKRTGVRLESARAPGRRTDTFFFQGREHAAAVREEGEVEHARRHGRAGGPELFLRAGGRAVDEHADVTVGSQLAHDLPHAPL